MPSGWGFVQRSVWRGIVAHGQSHGVRRARAEHARAARRRREPRRARRADGRRPPRLRHADRRRGRVPRPGVGRGRGLRHRVRQRGDPHRSVACTALRISPSRLGQLADEIQDVISFGIGRKNRADDAPVDHPLFESPAWERVPRHAPARPARARRARSWAPSAAAITTSMCSPTSRTRSGSACTSAAAASATRSPRGFSRCRRDEKWGARVPEREVLLSLDQPIGQDYWALMTLAGEYAYAGREWVARKVVVTARRPRAGAGAQPSQLRLARGARRRDLVVVRKGATPAFPGQKGFVGGSMGDDAVIVRGATAGGRRTVERCSATRCSRRCTARAG